MLKGNLRAIFVYGRKWRHEPPAERRKSSPAFNVQASLNSSGMDRKTDKGFVDPALEGTWKKIGMPGRNLNETPGPDRLLFVRDGLSYSFQAINPLDGTLSDDAAAQRKKDNDARTAVRTLRIGNHLFFLMRGQEGTTTKHPTAKNIVRNRGEGGYVVINTFDDEVFQILSEIADDADHWNLSCQYKKVS